MIYELLHKDVAVAELEMDEEGNVLHLLSVMAVDHLPFGTKPNRGLDSSGLKRWWGNRRIPMSRDDLRNIRGIILPEGASTGALLLHCNGLSLSDCYWVRVKGSSLTFEEVNFFENDYSYDLGDALLGKSTAETPSFLSPDATSEGNLAKRWKIINGKRTLLKSGTKPYIYEVYNEVIATAVAAHLGIPHVDYYLIQDEGDTYCACEDFVSYSQDFVTAYMVHEAGGKHDDESEYTFLLRRFEELGISDTKRRMDQMLMLDFILGNEDRHLNNFGLIRAAKSLRFLSFAPIFDTGSCLGFQLEDSALASSGPRPWKPFASSSRPNPLDYIEELPFDYPDALFSLPSIVDGAMSTMASLPTSRKNAILRFVSSRVADVAEKYNLERTMSSGRISKTQQAILDYAAFHGGRVENAKALCASLDMPWITAIRNIGALVSMGKLERIGSKKTGYWKLR